ALIALVACDLWVAAVRSWWDRHSFTSCVVSSLLVVGFTVLVLDEILARRQRRERATSVAVQGLIVYAQTIRAYDTINAVRGPVPVGSGAQLVRTARVDGEPEIEVMDLREARDEVRNLGTMILVASPSLFDDPEARLFLEEVQRLTAAMYAAVSLTSARPAPRRPEHVSALLVQHRALLDVRVAPLAARLPSQDRRELEESQGPPEGAVPATG
ncbi:MAG TPA: hypothetical protein VMD59_19170, partial [Acidimicrobiales bacterium]|nr:hypothetical protein [Acidimicrobiales bacterium]